MSAASASTSAANESTMMDTPAPASTTPDLTAYMSPAQLAGAGTAAGTVAGTMAPGSTELQTAAPRPRTRWAAIVWGLFFLAVATTALWIILDDDRREVAGSWIGGLNPWSAVTYLGLAVGVLLLVAGIAGLVRRAQRGTPPPATE